MPSRQRIHRLWEGGLFGAFSSKSPTREAAAAPSGTPASNTSYWTDVQGGGMFGFADVEAAERCTTKACNLYYGDAPTEEPEQPVVALPLAPLQATSDVTPLAPEPEHRSIHHRDSLNLVQREPGCTKNPQDPWHCYR